MKPNCTKEHNINVSFKKDVSGNTYFTAYFTDLDGCIGGGAAPKEAIDDANKNRRIFLSYLKQENK